MDELPLLQAAPAAGQRAGDGDERAERCAEAIGGDYLNFMSRLQLVVEVDVTDIEEDDLRRNPSEWLRRVWQGQFPLMEGEGQKARDQRLGRPLLVQGRGGSHRHRRGCSRGTSRWRSKLVGRYLTLNYLTCWLFTSSRSRLY